MTNLITRIKYIFSQRRFYSATLKKYGIFLKNGRYKPNNTFTQWNLASIAESENVLKEQLYNAENETKNKRLSYKIKRRLINYFYSIRLNVNHREFQGETLLLSRIVGGGKIISHSDGLILSFFPSSSDMMAVLERRNMFENDIFNICPILSVNNIHNHYVEKYIKKKPYDINKAFEYMCETTLNFQKSEYCHSSNAELNLTKDYLITIIDDERILLEIIDFTSSRDYIKCLCHGDLYRNNIIYDGDRFYYIDFELAGEHVFFFDILYFAMMEYYRFNNSEIIDMYFNGKLDAYFTELFNAHKATYNPYLKKSYFFVMLYEYFCVVFKCKIPESLLYLVKK